MQQLSQAPMADQTETGETNQRRPLKLVTKRKILVVDDEARIVELLRRELGRLYRVYTATSGEEALEVLDREPIVLVIADQRMPGMTGTELMERVVERSPETMRILLTGYTDLNALVDAINRGQVYRYISKPWEPEELKIVVKQSMERYELREQNLALVKDLRERNLELREAMEELKRAQRELLRSERHSAIGKMANMIVHDLKNPLTSILGLTDTLLSIPIQDDQKRLEYYSMIRNESDRILRMVQEILEYVRGETPSLSLQAVELGGYLEEVRQEIQRFLNGTSIQFAFQMEDPGLVRLDPERFKRAIHNLVGNARDAMKAGGSLRLSVQGEDGHVCFRVTDTGGGIPEELQENVFEPFFTRGKATGSGLGLAIVKRIVDAHHGEIVLESSGEAGTTFLIRIPQRQ